MTQPSIHRRSTPGRRVRLFVLVACSAVASAPVAAAQGTARDDLPVAAVETGAAPTAASGLGWAGQLTPGSRVALTQGADGPRRTDSRPAAAPSRGSLAAGCEAPDLALAGPPRAAKPATRKDIAWLSAEEVRRTAAATRRPRTSPSETRVLAGALRRALIAPAAIAARTPTAILASSRMVAPARARDHRETHLGEAGPHRWIEVTLEAQAAPASVETATDELAATSFDPPRLPLVSPWSTDTAVVYTVGEPPIPDSAWPGDIQLSRRSNSGVVFGVRDLFSDTEYQAGCEHFGPARIQDSSAYLRFDRGF